MSQPWADSREVSEENNPPTADTSIQKMFFTLPKKPKKKPKTLERWTSSHESHGSYVKVT